jgi:hypothetical protein
MVEENTLVVRATGVDENLSQVRSYGLAIINAAKEHGVTRVLCDERELEYRLGTFATYEAAAFISSQAPSVSRAAIICRADLLPDALFWETVAVNRGLLVRVFKEMAPAKAWLDELASDPFA